MKDDKRSVQIIVQVTQSSTTQPSTTQQTETEGFAYQRGSSYYLRYSEVGESMAGVTTTLKLNSQEITLLRHGNVRSEQRFRLMKTCLGTYQTAEGCLRLETFTHQLEHHLDEWGLGRIAWSYQLKVSEMDAGEFAINIEVQEARQP
jgi:uncharacterized beta-barrel protein YwiB (DUF1934 family)